ncbi:MAG: hypothetical protein CM1200mP33_7160 [Chloroflexota bacterium]|nr:MAG: hypothetical protein CM1200mP33_7160 [Chloroflexota bacterium]
MAKFCCFIRCHSVGVMGDHRTYEYTIAIRAVKSEDAMTADWARIPYEVLDKISSRITNEVHGVNRWFMILQANPQVQLSGSDYLYINAKQS